MPVRDRVEYHLVGFVVDTLVLDSQVEEGLGAEISLVPELRGNYRMS